MKYLLIAFTLTACTLGIKSEFAPKGLYECTSAVNHNAPVFRFNSESDSTLVYVGTNNHLEFFDLNSKQIVELYEDSYNYSCTCIDSINQQ